MRIVGSTAHRDLNASQSRTFLLVLPSPLGWMALVGCGNVIRQLTFGHSSSERAARALDPELLDAATHASCRLPLVRRLQDYASGVAVDFSDVRIDPGKLTEFRRRVFRRCRAIPYGRTLSYGQLAAAAGYPGAARAVGTCMAGNRIPLIIPCHRVVRSDGRPGAFSAPGGTRMKQRLLALEAG